MAKQKPVFSYEQCVACGMCATVCPVSAIELSVVGKLDLRTCFPALSARPCTGCGLCEKTCPMDAIVMENL